MRKVKDKIIHLKLILAILLLIPATAFPTVTTFEYSDEMTGKSWSGIKIRSNDFKASLNFICDSGTIVPRILFSHEEFLTSSGSEFTLAYRIDDNDIRRYEFVARPNNKSGRLKVTPQLSDLWKVITDFVKGNSAFVRVWDYNGKAYTYKFDLPLIVHKLEAIESCYP